MIPVNFCEATCNIKLSQVFSFTISYHHQNKKLCRTLKHNKIAAKNFDILGTSLNVQYKYFNGPT
jgi:hypothetical protein